jgi:hypothetical protein
VAEVADRYVRTGPPNPLDPPRIYHGDLRGVSDALRDICAQSKKIPGTHTLRAVYNRTPYMFRTYEGGECTGQWEQPDLSS